MPVTRVAQYNIQLARAPNAIDTIAAVESTFQFQIIESMRAQLTFNKLAAGAENALRRKETP